MEKMILVPYDKYQRLLKNVVTEPETKKNSATQTTENTHPIIGRGPPRLGSPGIRMKKKPKDQQIVDQIEKPIHWIEYK